MKRMDLLDEVTIAVRRGRQRRSKHPRAGGDPGLSHPDHLWGPRTARRTGETVQKEI
jgi:hypothetical protein